MAYQRDQLPSAYAHDYTNRGVGKSRGANGELLRQIAAQTLPGVPVEMLYAFIAPGYPGANTTEGSSAQAHEVPFHEVSEMQIPAGPRDGPAPNPNPSAGNNTWGHLAHDPRVVNVLGRAAVTAPNAWRTAIADAYAIGTVMLADNYTATASRMDPSIRPSSMATPWGVAAMMTGFSAGPAGAAALFNHYAAQLAGTSEQDRFAKLVNLVAVDVQNGVRLGGAADRHSNPFHRALRTAQKFALAESIAHALGDDAGAAFYALPLGDQKAAHEDLLERGNELLPPGQLAVTPLTFEAPSIIASDAGKKLGGAALIGLAFFALWKALGKG